MLSLRQINHRYLHFSAGLGIVAILMLFIAPVVSKSLVSAGVMHRMMPGMSGMDMSSINMPEDGMLPAQKGEHGDHTDIHHAMSSGDKGQGMMTGDMSDAACGYCVLLAHLPLLHILALSLLWSSEVSGQAPPFLLANHFRSPAFYNDAQPRAPPDFQ
ncbi:DUF2946 domain-containing protein [Hafnia psychrotolerans]|nr:DUF2946 domain-containing protein [Hafnia psychrotolerans]